MRLREGLTAAQRDALDYIDDYARRVETVGLTELDNVLAMSNLTPHQFAEGKGVIETRASVCLQFHPDRSTRGGKSVVESLLEQGFYRNQFETRLSNGKLDPVAGGVRATWEDSLFGGAFSRHGSSLSERPKYGALDLMLFPDGPAPRFGSCYFRLKPSVNARCSFTYLDSHRGPTERGTITTFEPLLAALLTECFERRSALGMVGISPSQLFDHLLSRLPSGFVIEPDASPGRNLNHYIEAQVHGDVDLWTDVEALVADPSFRETPVGQTIRDLCRRYSLELLWHRGFRLQVEEVPDDFRGPRMPELARRIAARGEIDAYRLGQAALSVHREPGRWTEWGTPSDTLQDLKRLWHCLVMFG